MTIFKVFKNEGNANTTKTVQAVEQDQLSEVAITSESEETCKEKS